ncbi:DNA polymerase III subunit epsilon [Ferrovum myxofaciens]|jgi:DNA polymerase-3 subunit epsilon|uniref:DNA polymerase III subunit epsilon n=3 Tax=root TaxID=1 RepID=A0A9E6MXT9_9PROT|nr:DNA polymerase III subunit epsilon [Ferrovum myxofaciens]MBU6993971.1 DNA polymerase III subunit epsilon [Ferrovum myxofaciens]QKE37914.1 MAG: DNA polymerase III subunit epsilon [Ferrovum myxofaciens]QKE40523.1 MAG: DNA polymerase III subunit epsilon [Ferrovum myxofaciens]QWY75606.1 MAG: DNA polymerase III subunit epsilon [Ferrovum myxofaciens]QWY78343.1 MAG: DNA polymerase III subunit epsilon [Ferrovum myxofaciens]
MRWVMLDTETTGLDPRQGHRLVEIGLVEILTRRRARTWHHYLNPRRESDPGALEKHGLTTDFLKDKPPFGSVVESFIEFLCDSPKGMPLNCLVIHNAAFDLGFLDHELSLLGRPALLAHLPEGVLVDSLKVARELFPGKRNSLDALCERYEIDHAHRTFHGALLDAELLGEVYLAMTRGQEHLLMPEETSPGSMQMPGYVASVSAHGLRVPKATEEEMEAHRTQLERIHQASGGRVLWRPEIA